MESRHVATGPARCHGIPDAGGRERIIPRYPIALTGYENAARPAGLIGPSALFQPFVQRRLTAIKVV